MATTIKFKRGIRANLDALASSNALVAGEPILITDEGRIAICTSDSTYEEFAKSYEAYDHTQLSNLPWTSSGHTGTAGMIAGFNGVGNPLYFPYPAAPTTHSDILASTWVADSTYSGYGYKCDLEIEVATATKTAIVVFSHTDSLSGNYSPVCETGTETVTIYSKVNTTITIPTIIII